MVLSALRISIFLQIDGEIQLMSWGGKDHFPNIIIQRVSSSATGDNYSIDFWTVLKSPTDVRPAIIPFTTASVSNPVTASP